MSNNSFDWVDVLLKRWQVILFIAGAIAWVTTMQVQQLALATEQAKISNQIEAFGEIRAEWPYLKQKVNSMDSKIDKILMAVKQ